MTLSHLIDEIEYTQLWGDDQLPIGQIDFDSRQVNDKSLFVAVKGTQTDGHQYINAVLNAGTKVIIAERDPSEEELKTSTAWVKVPNTAIALGQLASAFYGHPSRWLKLIGVTGTNGKTTTATILYQLFQELGFRTGLLSTVENCIGDQVLGASHTTPDAVQINQLLAKMVDAGCEYAFMEVSSHAIDQHRIESLQFVGGIFTNISKDHLEYHGSMKNYIEVKKKFFDNLPKEAFALVNIDDKRGDVMLQNTKAAYHRYSLRSMADFKARVIENTAQGLHLDMNGDEIFTRLLGGFNAYNLLAAYGTAILLKQDKDEILRVLSGIKGAAGRASYVRDPSGKITAVIDYAHTTDALDKICQTLKDILPKGKKLITVFGCGGDRDKAKRPLMANAACKHSNTVIITTDNPRTEAPEAILDDIEKGVPEEMKTSVLRISDRRSAILTACSLANVGDVVLVAGKGHENYQDIMGTKQPFDDTQVLNDYFTRNIKTLN